MGTNKLPADWPDHLKPPAGNGPLAPPPSVTSQGRTIRYEWGYCRQSPSEHWATRDKETVSLAGQCERLLREIEKVIQEDGSQLAEIVQDPWMSAVENEFLNRPVARGLMTKMQPADRLWVVDLDRLGRTQRDILNSIHYLSTNGIRLRALSYRGRDFDPLDVSAKAWLAMMSFVAEAECDQRHQRQLAANDYRRRHNIPMTRSRRPGEKRVFVTVNKGTDKEHKVITQRVVVLEELEQLRSIWHRSRKKGESYYRIVREEQPLNAEGHPYNDSALGALLQWCDKLIKEGMNPFTYPPSQLSSAPAPPSSASTPSGANGDATGSSPSKGQP